MGKPRAVSTKEQSWRDLIRRQAQSGQSIRAFCASESVSEASFHWWRRELTGRRGDARTEPSTKPLQPSRPEFVPIAVTSPPRPAIEIELPAGILVRVLPGASSEQLREVLAALETSRC
jgi:hypothetical protein